MIKLDHNMKANLILAAARALEYVAFASNTSREERQPFIWIIVKLNRLAMFYLRRED